MAESVHTMLQDLLTVSATLHSPHSRKLWDKLFLRSYCAPEVTLQDLQPGGISISAC